jgi:hypothetical protein
MENHKKSVIENPALKSLGDLVGEWKTVGKHPYLSDIVLGKDLDLKYTRIK